MNEYYNSRIVVLNNKIDAARFVFFFHLFSATAIKKDLRKQIQERKNKSVGGNQSSKQSSVIFILLFIAGAFFSCNCGVQIILFSRRREWNRYRDFILSTANPSFIHSCKFTSLFLFSLMKGLDWIELAAAFQTSVSVWNPSQFERKISWQQMK